MIVIPSFRSKNEQTPYPHGNSDSDGHRLFKPYSRLFLPYFPVARHRGGGTGAVSDDLSGSRDRLRTVRRLHPDRHLPAGGLRRPPRAGGASHRTFHLALHCRSADRIHLLFSRRPGRVFPAGAGLRPASAGHGPVHSVLRGSRVYLRLLLWAQESQGARRLPAGGTGHTDFFCISCGGYIF